MILWEPILIYQAIINTQIWRVKGNNRLKRDNAGKEVKKDNCATYSSDPGLKTNAMA